jgi:DNA polymerase III alpha subunit
MFEATLFSETLSQHRDSLVAGTPLLLSVDVQGKPDEYRLTVQGVEKLEMVAARESQGLALVLGMEKAIAPLQTIAAKLPKGKSRIQIKIDIDGEEEAEIELSGRYTIPPDMRSEIKGLAGILEVQDL